jgi:hypothetical protein
MEPAEHEGGLTLDIDTCKSRRALRKVCWHAFNRYAQVYKATPFSVGVAIRIGCHGRRRGPHNIKQRCPVQAAPITSL